MSLLTLSHYTSGQKHHRERQRLFRSTWLLAGHIRQLEPYTQYALNIAGIPIVLWNTGSDIKAFANMCRHRGAPLLSNGEHHKGTQLRCSYHGWIYDDTGTLVNNTDLANPCQDLQLHRLQVWIRAGWIFVSWNPQTNTPKEIYPTLFDNLSEMKQWTIRSKSRDRVGCNWKVYVENQLKDYCEPLLTPSSSKEITLSLNTTPQPKRDLHVHITGKGFRGYCWPNLFVTRYSAGIRINRILPLSVNETDIEYWYMFPPETSQDTVDGAIEHNNHISIDDIQRVESIQLSMESGLYTGYPISQKEKHGIAAFQHWVEQCLQ